MKLTGPTGPYKTGNGTRYYAGVVCTIDAAAGQPRFTIAMEGRGEEPGEVLTESTISTQASDSFHADHFATLSIMSSVNVTCHVTDDAGTYFTKKWALTGRIQTRICRSRDLCGKLCEIFFSFFVLNVQV